MVATVHLRANGRVIRAHRRNKIWSQDQLAKNCKVDERTIQRAEAGEKILPETAASIASALELTLSQITEDGDNDNQSVEENDIVVLRRTQSAHEVVDCLSKAELHKLECKVDPTPETVEALVAFVEGLEVLDPHPVDPHSEMGKRTLGNRVRLTARVAELMSQLAARGIGVFCGEYITLAKRWRWDVDEQCWYTRDNQLPEPLLVGVVEVSSSSVDKVVRRVTDKWNDNDEIPPF